MPKTTQVAQTIQTDVEDRYRGVTMPQYHELSGKLDDCINQLTLYHNIISEQQASLLRSIINEVDGAQEFTIDEVSMQYQIFLQMQAKILDGRGELLMNTDVRDISSVLSAMTSLISLFLKASKEIDSIKEEAKLKAAVLVAVEGLDPDRRAAFFAVLQEGA